MKKLFFFPFAEKKNTVSRSNEWMTCELLQEKKNTKKTPKNVEKKKHTPLSKKIKKNPPDPEWMAHELFLGKKKHTLVFFFSASRKKKHTILRFEWMNGPWTLSGKKKYGTFDKTKHFFNFPAPQRARAYNIEHLSDLLAKINWFWSQNGARNAPKVVLYPHSPYRAFLNFLWSTIKSDFDAVWPPPPSPKVVFYSQNVPIISSIFWFLLPENQLWFWYWSSNAPIKSNIFLIFLADNSVFFFYPRKWKVPEKTVFGTFFGFFLGRKSFFSPTFLKFFSGSLKFSRAHFRFFSRG